MRSLRARYFRTISSCVAGSSAGYLILSKSISSFVRTSRYDNRSVSSFADASMDERDVVDEVRCRLRRTDGVATSTASNNGDGGVEPDWLLSADESPLLGSSPPAPPEYGR